MTIGDVKPGTEFMARLVDSSKFVGQMRFVKIGDTAYSLTHGLRYSAHWEIDSYRHLCASKKTIDDVERSAERYFARGDLEYHRKELREKMKTVRYHKTKIKKAKRVLKGR